MAHSDSEDEGDDLEFDAEEDAEPELEDEILDAGADDATEDGDDDSGSDDSEDGSDDDDDDESEPSGEAAPDVDGDTLPSDPIADASGLPSSLTPSQLSKAPSPVPPTRKRSLSPAQLRKKALLLPTSLGVYTPRSYTVEAICALPHPVPTHALASSFCMTHLLTGSEDGYIRDYDIFTAVNSKNFLTAPQRHHSGVVEGIMKSGQIRCWWENPDIPKGNGMVPEEEPSLSPVYSLAMHSDALWTLAGTDAGHINLFTVRHEPGRLCHVMNGHRGPVSALSMDHDEKGFFSAGWDGEALQWDLNTGQVVRNFTAHGAQLAAIAVRPANSVYSGTNTPVVNRLEAEAPQSSTQPISQSIQSGSTTLVGSSTGLASTNSEDASQIPSQDQHMANTQPPNDSDAKSDVSFDPLFDDEPDAEGETDNNGNGEAQQTAGPTHSDKPPMNPSGGPGLAMPKEAQPPPQPPRATLSSIAPPKNAPPLLDSTTYWSYSPDLLMTASIDGQVILWDKRVHSPGTGVGRLWMSEKTPPWCLSACWSADGGQIYAGRRNGTVDVWDVRQLGRSGNTPRLLKTLRNPLSSGVVSCVVAFPDGRHIACASNDNLRLWNAAEAGEPDGSGKMKSGVQFKIIPGHHGGYISQMLVDPGARFLVSASSNRGWHGDSTRTVFVHDIKYVQ